MERAQLLRLELQAQKARIALEKQQREQLVESAYNAVFDLNFLGYTPCDLQQYDIPDEILKDSYTHFGLPIALGESRSKTSPLPANAALSTHPIVSGVSSAQGAGPLGLPARSASPPPKKSKKKRKKGLPQWDSEWVAPKVVKFGDDHWSSNLSIEISSSESEDENVSPVERDIVAEASELEALIRSCNTEINNLMDVAAEHDKVIDQHKEFKIQIENQIDEKKRAASNARVKLRALSSLRQTAPQSNPAELHPHASRKQDNTITAGESIEGISLISSSGDESQVGHEIVDIGDSDAEMAEAQAITSVTSQQSQALGLSDSQPDSPAPISASPEPTAAAEDGPKSLAEIHSNVIIEPNVSTESVPAANKRAEIRELATEYKDYELQSPLSRMASYRIKPMWIKGYPLRAYSRTFNSVFATGQDSDRYFCENEAQGRACTVQGCEDLHSADFDVPSQQVLSHVLKTYVNISVRKRFAQRVRELADPNAENSMALLLECAQET